MVEEIVEVDKFEDEDKLMKDYEHFMKLMEEWTSLSNLTRFHDSAIAQEDERVYMYYRQTDRQTDRHADMCITLMSVSTVGSPVCLCHGGT